MGVLNSLLFAAHLIGLVLIVGATLVLWRAGDVLARGEGSPGVVRLGRRLAALGNVGLGLSWISGPVLLFTKYAGLGAIVSLGPWFWLKLVLAVALSGLLGAASAGFRRAATSQPTAAARVEGIGGIAVICAFGVIVAAAFTFG